MIRVRDLKKHIKKREAEGKRLDLLGFVENKELSNEVEGMFKFTSPGGSVGYDWVNGNDKLKKLIKELKIGKIN